MFVPFIKHIGIGDQNKNGNVVAKEPPKANAVLPQAVEAWSPSTRIKSNDNSVGPDGPNTVVWRLEHTLCFRLSRLQPEDVHVVPIERA